MLPDQSNSDALTDMTVETVDADGSSALVSINRDEAYELARIWPLRWGKLEAEMRKRAHDDAS